MPKSCSVYDMTMSRFRTERKLQHMIASHHPCLRHSIQTLSFDCAESPSFPGWTTWISSHRLHLDCKRPSPTLVSRWMSSPMRLSDNHTHESVWSGACLCELHSSAQDLRLMMSLFPSTSVYMLGHRTWGWRRTITNTFATAAVATGLTV